MFRGITAALTMAALSFGSAGQTGQAPDSSDLEQRIRMLENEIEKLRDELMRDDPRFDRFGSRLQDMLRGMGQRAQPAEGRAFLGVSLGEVDRMEGALVHEVVPGSAADEAGIEPGDIVTEFGGRQVRVVRDLVDFVGECKAGDKASLKVLRGDRLMPMTVVLGSANGGRHLQGGQRMRGLPDFFGGQRPPVEPEVVSGQAIEVEVELEDGRAKASVAVPGLFLSEEIVRELSLSDAQRARVESAFAEARDALAERLAAALREEGMNGFDGAFVGRARAEAEASARERLEGALDAEQLAGLQAAQARMGSRSEFSISRSHGEGFGRRPPVSRTAPEAPQCGGMRDF